MSDKKIVEICYTRFMCGLSCKDCIYYGKPCEKLKHKLNVSRPYEIEDLILKRKKEIKNYD